MGWPALEAGPLPALVSHLLDEAARLPKDGKRDGVPLTRLASSITGVDRVDLRRLRGYLACYPKVFKVEETMRTSRDGQGNLKRSPAHFVSLRP